MAGRVVVFGSSGFIGGRLCREAASRGLSVVGISRSGKAPPYLVSHSPDDVAAKVKFEGADASAPETYAEHLKGAQAVLVAVGGPPVPNFFYKGGKAEAIAASGTTCVRAIAAAKKAGVPRVVLVNAAMPAWLSSVSSGYFTGKTMSEAAAREYAGGKTSAVCLKPAVVFGTRYAGEAQFPVPLWLVVQPLRFAMRLPVVDSVVGFLRTRAPYVFDNLLAEPVEVDELARTALDCALDPVDKPFTSLGPEEIVRRSHKRGLAELSRN